MQAELEAYLPSMKGPIRIWAERIRQLGPNTFHAQTCLDHPQPVSANPATACRRRTHSWNSGSASRRSVRGIAAGRSGHRQSGIGDPELDHVAEQCLLHRRRPRLLPAVHRALRPTSRRCPWKASCSARTRSSAHQVRTQWDLAKLLGFTEPHGSQWTLLADYLSERGPAVGVNGKYHGNNLFGIPGKYNGEL